MSRVFEDGAGSGIETGSSFNYVRNSVKAVVDAYDGTTTLYVNDPTDPLIATWAAVYPTLFTPLSSLPADLWPHLRYPEGLFNVQTGMFEGYHVTDPTTFYQGDNLWTVPNGSQAKGQTLPGRGVLRPDAAARRGPDGVPAHPADGARAADRT